MKRFLTALVLAPLMLAGIYLLPDGGFRLFIGAILLLGMWEWTNLSGITTPALRVAWTAALLALMAVVNWQVDVSSSLWPVLVMSALAWWAVACYLVIRFPNHSGWLMPKHWRLLVSVPVLGGFWMGLVWLKVQPEAWLLLTWLMLLVWGADIGAYYAGKNFGKRKLAPKVSPGKTWAGLYGGMLASVVLSVIVAALFLPDHSVKGWAWLLLLSSAVVLISVMGDLFESMLKRHRGIKDSSALLPGHGGVLDRIDSLCAATPLFVLMWFVLSVV